MTNSLANALFCVNIGAAGPDLGCCYIDNQKAGVCNRNFGTNSSTFSIGCNNGDCISQCQLPEFIYRSDSQDDASSANIHGPVQRFRTCANVPAMSRFADQHDLSDEIASLVGTHIQPNPSDNSLKKITAVVTECLTQTCKASRNHGACSALCSPVNMLTNPTTPNLSGIDQCLNKLCTGGYGSLPYADPDVVGIGVFSSYILQCIFLIIIWLGLFFFERYNCEYPPNVPETEGEKPPKLTPPIQTTPQSISARSGDSSKAKVEVTHQSLLETCLVQFHVSQCYFSATIQIASLTYGIFSTDMLVAFLLLPLSINGVLPIVFGFLLLFRYGRDSMDITLLTTVCWLLSSIVYWILYAHIIRIKARFNSEERRYMAYQQLTYKLSALASCGGYSALAACPSSIKIGKEEVISASQKLHYLTPIIWVFSTICLLLVLAAKFVNWHKNWKNQAYERHGSQKEGTGNTAADNSVTDQEQSRPTYTTIDSPLLEEVRISTEDENVPYHQRQSHTAPSVVTSPPHNKMPVAFFRSNRSFHTVWAITTICFLIGICFQLSLLSISSSLKMMNDKDWGFGQIVAVVVWVPPLLEYMYSEFEKSVAGKLKARLGLEKEAH